MRVWGIKSRISSFFIGSGRGFDHEFLQKELRGVPLLTWLAAALFSGWSAIDYYFSPDRYPWLSTIRLVTSGIIVVLGLWGYRKADLRGAITKFIIFTAFPLSCSFVVTQMSDQISPMMLSGTVIVFVCSAAFLKWRTNVFIVWAVLVMSGQLVLNLSFKPLWETIFASLLLGTSLSFAGVFSILNARLLRTDFDQRREIEEQQKSLSVAYRETESVFATIHESIVSFDQNLKIKVASRALYTTWGEITSFQEVLNEILDPEANAKTMSALFAMLGENELGIMVNEETLARKTVWRDRHFSLGWSFIVDDSGVCTGGTASIKDDTADVMAQRKQGEADARVDMLLVKLKNLLAGNPKSIRSFMRDMPTLLGNLEELSSPNHGGSHADLLRNLHTIKGVGRVLKLADLSALSHRIESAYKEGRREEIWKGVETLKEEFSDYEKAFNSFFHSDDALHLGVLDIVHSMKDDIISRLNRASIPFRGFYIRDELGPVPKMIENSLLHGITNAIDHGFINPFKAGKKTADVRLDIRAFAREGRHIIEVRDNGAGISWAVIDRICQEKNFQAAMGRPSTDVLFLDGVSTAREVSMTSGRGVGMGAIKESMLSLSGDVSLIDNDEGPGSMLILSWPLPALTI